MRIRLPGCLLVMAVDIAYHALPENVNPSKAGVRANAVMIMFIRIAAYSPVSIDARAMMI